MGRHVGHAPLKTTREPEQPGHDALAVIAFNLIRAWRFSRLPSAGGLT
jgi:hypothetical protein